MSLMGGILLLKFEDSFGLAIDLFGYYQNHNYRFMVEAFGNIPFSSVIV